VQGLGVDVVLEMSGHPFEQIHEAMEIMKSGDCGKIVLTF